MSPLAGVFWFSMMVGFCLAFIDCCQDLLDE